MPRNGVWKKEYGERRLARLRAARMNKWGVIDEGETMFAGSLVRTIRILRGGEPLELLHGADVGRALGLGATRLTDWTAGRAIPPAVEISKARIRYFTSHQVELLAELASVNACGASEAKLAQRDHFIRQLWAEWWAE